MINQDWKIRSRAHTCSHTGRAFTEGEIFTTALFIDPKSAELTRNDYSAEAWDALASELKPFSFWKTEYVPPEKKEEEPEPTIGKESPDELLRRLVEENEEFTEKARYILAVMLERGKTLRQTDTQITEGSKLLIYEHRITGEVLIIRDPELHLDQVEAVQEEVTELLENGGRPAPEEEEESEQPEAEPMDQASEEPSEEDTPKSEESEESEDE